MFSIKNTTSARRRRTLLFQFFREHATRANLIPKIRLALLFLAVFLPLLSLLCVGITKHNSTYIFKGLLLHTRGQRFQFTRIEPQDVASLIRYTEPRSSVASRNTSSRFFGHLLEDDLHRALHRSPQDPKIKVRIATTSNRVSPMMCMAQASAILSGIPFTVLNYEEPYTHVGRFKHFLRFMDEEKLSDDDIVILLDSDACWTGSDIAPFLARFARLSPPDPEALDVCAVRAWEDYGEVRGQDYAKEVCRTNHVQMPPLLFNAELYCHRVQTAPGERCTGEYDFMEAIISSSRDGKSYTSIQSTLLTESIIAPDGWTDTALRSIGETGKGAFNYLHDNSNNYNSSRIEELASRFPPVKPRPAHAARFPFVPNYQGMENPSRYFNAGGAVTRVWALRQLIRAFHDYTEQHKPNGEPLTHWHCDQSVLSSMYLAGRVWEAEQQLLDMPLPHSRRYNPFGLFAGMMGIDRRSEFFFLTPDQEFEVHYTSTNYLKDTQSRCKATRGPAEAEVSGEVSGSTFGRLSVARSTALLTPPLLRRLSFPEDQRRQIQSVEESDADAIFPLAIHLAGSWKDVKYSRFRNYMRWFFAASRDATARRRAEKVLQAAEIEFWGKRSRYYVPFVELCGFPF